MSQPKRRLRIGSRAYKKQVSDRRWGRVVIAAVTDVMGRKEYEARSAPAPKPAEPLPPSKAFDRTRSHDWLTCRESCCYAAKSDKPRAAQLTASVLQCSWCKRTDVTWTNTPKGKMHVDCPMREAARAAGDPDA